MNTKTFLLIALLVLVGLVVYFGIDREDLQTPTPSLSPDTAACRPTGCSGQMCADEDVVTTCEFKPEYACYRTARCERQPSGECGWTMTSDLQSCLGRL